MSRWKKLYSPMVLLAAALIFVRNPGTAEETQNTLPEKPLVIRDLPEFRITGGAVLFSRYCSFCHGESGTGDGLNAYSIPVAPRDFTDPDTMARKTDSDLAKVISAGGPSQGLSPYMPSFGETLSARQVEQLVGFIRKIQDGGNE